MRTLLAGFSHTDEAGGAVSGTIASGVLPAAIEMMDALTIEAAEAAVGAGYPEGAGAVLIVELDGVLAQVEADLAEVERICREHGASEIRVAADADERARIWRGRKAAFAAMGRISPDYYVQDGVVPRTKLSHVLRQIDALSREAGLRVGNVFHAGDGNLHPLVLYDAHEPGEAERAERLATAILVACVDAGGSITGEHGVGADKACAMPLMFSETDLAAMQRLRPAFDPNGLANPGKAFPTPRRSAATFPGPTEHTRWRRQGSLSGSRVLEYEPGDLTCVVEAGLRISELQAVLAPHRNRFSLDPPGDPTLGDCLLEDLSGPLSHRFGTMRDLAIGVTVVLPDGTRGSSGGKVVKNVAGYDLGKLFCGSRGRLGTVERLALRLHPAPETARTVVTDRGWGELHRSQLVPSAVDLADEWLHVLFEGSPAAVEAQVAALAGAESDPWDELRVLQATLSGRVRWDGQDAPLVPLRPAGGLRRAPV